MTGLFATDAELIRDVMQIPEKIGRRAIAALDAGVPGKPKFPIRDPRFGGRRYVPAVVQWFHDYYGVRLLSGEPQVTIQSTWAEHFDDIETPKAGRHQHARTELARA